MKDDVYTFEAEEALATKDDVEVFETEVAFRKGAPKRGGGVHQAPLGAYDSHASPATIPHRGKRVLRKQRLPWHAYGVGSG